GVLVALPPSAEADHRTDQVYRVAIRATAYVFTDSNTGTGVLVDAERRLLVTNYHVARKNEKVGVVFPTLKEGLPTGDREYYLKSARKMAITGKVIARDPVRDLVLIELEALPAGVRAIKLASQPVKVGEWTVMVTGVAANAKPWRALPGIVKKVDDYSSFNAETGQKIAARMVFTEVACLPGDSGSAVGNAGGAWVAIHQGGHTRSIDVRELWAMLGEKMQR